MALTPYMSTLIRDPFEIAVDRMFEEAVRAVGLNVTTWTPSCDVYEDDNAFCVQVALPGMDPKDIEVLIEEDVCTVKGERKGHPEASKASWLIREMGYGPFNRSFTLPSSVDHSKAKASYKDGILTIEFPKSDEAKPRRLLIESK